MPDPNGLITITPTSVTSAGGTTSINLDGSVWFQTVTTLRIDGIFSAAYRHYMIVMNDKTTSSGTQQLKVRFRSGGTDITTFDYAHQRLQCSSSTTALRTTSAANGVIGNASNLGLTGQVLYIFAPATSAHKTINAIDCSSFGFASFFDSATVCTSSAICDGLTIFLGPPTFSGTLTVFAFNE